MTSNPSIAICGAGIAGVACAHYLSKYKPQLKIILIDKNQPLSFTTSKSGENYRDYWPQENMSHFVSRSIDLMKEIRTEYGADTFDLQSTGYHFVSHAKEFNFLGLTPNQAQQYDVELIHDAKTIHSQYPYLDHRIDKLLHIKNAGSMDVHRLGSFMLKSARSKGAQFIQQEIVDMKREKSRFTLLLKTGEIVNSDLLLISAGPFINHLASMIGLHFPIFNTRQNKIFMQDPKKIIPRDMPFTIYVDEQKIEWSEDEKEVLISDAQLNFLIHKLPGGIHIKPEGNGVKMGWAFNTENESPCWNTTGSELFPQIVLKGICRFIPALSTYEKKIPTPLIHYSGYYTRTKENWPLVGPTEIPNAFVIGALAGYGTMSACAAGELCAKSILEMGDLPNYATFFSPLRYNNPEIMQLINSSPHDGQL